MLLVLMIWNNKSFFFLTNMQEMQILGSFVPQNFPMNLIDENFYDNQDQIKQIINHR